MKPKIMLAIFLIGAFAGLLIETFTMPDVSPLSIIGIFALVGATWGGAAILVSIAYLIAFKA